MTNINCYFDSGIMPYSPIEKSVILERSLINRIFGVREIKKASISYVQEMGGSSESDAFLIYISGNKSKKVLPAFFGPFLISRYSSFTERQHFLT